MSFYCIILSPQPLKETKLKYERIISIASQEWVQHFCTLVCLRARASCRLITVIATVVFIKQLHQKNAASTGSWRTVVIMLEQMQKSTCGTAPGKQRDGRSP